MSLIAHYPLNGDVKNIVTGNVPPSVNMQFGTGKINQCALFDGTPRRIDIDGILGNPGKGSIAMWYKRTTTDVIYLADGRAGLDGSWWLISNYSNQDINFFDLVTFDNVPLDTWTHLVVTSDANQTQMFVNGVLVDTGAGHEISFDNVTIGARYSNSQYFNGSIDDIRFYDHVLSQREVSELYKASCFQASLRTSSAAGPFPVTTIEDSGIVYNDGFVGDGTAKDINYSGLDLTFSELTLSVKARLDQIGQNYVFNTSLPREMLLKWADNKTNTLTVGVNGWFTVGIPTYQLGEEIHVIVTYDGSFQKVFVDGDLRATVASSGTTSINDLVIGSTGSSYYFKGRIRDFQIFARSFTDQEAVNYYQTGLAIDNYGRMHSKYIKEGFPYLSVLDSATANFPAASADTGFNDVDGESEPCSGLLTFPEAVAYAKAQGGRLPTKEEMENDAVATTGCNYDDDLCWTCTKGEDDSEHWVVVGRSINAGASPSEIRKNDELAPARYVTDNDLNRTDPVFLSDRVIQEALEEDTTKIKRNTTGHNVFSEVGNTDKMVLWQPCDGRTIDLASRNDGVIVGTVNAVYDDKFGKVYEFMGHTTTSYINLGTPDELQFESNSPLTVSAWINPYAFSTRDMIFCKNNSRGAAYTFLFGLINGDLNAYTGSVWRSFETTALIPLNDWTFVTWTFDGINLSGYINGVLVGTRGDFTYTNNAAHSSKVGGYADTTDFEGKLYRVRVHKAALTPEQVAQEYSSSSKAMINKNTAFAKEFIEV